MKAINNKQGSALVWVLVICLIFGLLGIAIGWVALSMNRRSIKNDNLNQSYFTALSTANSVFKDVYKRQAQLSVAAGKMPEMRGEDRAAVFLYRAVRRAAGPAHGRAL